MLPASAQGRFDLQPGRWQGPVKGVGIVTLEIGDANARTFKIGMQMMTAEARSAVAEGTYQVTAAKGPPHVTFHVNSVKTLHLETDALRGYSFAGWTLRPGADVRAIIDYQSGLIVVDGCDSENTEHTVRFRLQQVQ